MYVLFFFRNFLEFGEKAPNLLSDYEVPRFFREDFLEVLDKKRPPWRWYLERKRKKKKKIKKEKEIIEFFFFK